MSQTQTQQFIECYWKPATSDDAYCEPPLPARFCNRGQTEWPILGILVARKRGEFPWVSGDSRGIGYSECEVYKVIDPGEGYRLLDPEKDEPKKGDEVWDYDSETWDKLPLSKRFYTYQYYRRPLVGPEEYLPFDWKTFGSLMDRWIVSKNDAKMIFRINRFSASTNGSLKANGYTASRLLEDFLFLDTKKPVGIKPSTYEEHVSGTAALLSEKV